jgi:uncharacterized membrane protein YesL
MKKAWLPLRIGAVISLFFAIGHTIGGVRASWSPIAENAVLAAMRTFHFDFAGVNRTYLELYRGFGFLLTVYLLLQAVLLWQLAGIARTDRKLALPMVWSFFLATIVMSVLTWIYLFPTPVYFDVALLACLGWALIAAVRA